MIKTLLFSTLYPNSVQQQHGVFVENRLRHLIASKVVETRVIAPVPWFPFKSDIFGKYGKFARVAYKEDKNNIEVIHPRYFLLPKIGMNMAPEALFRTVLPQAKKLIANGYDFDLIDAHYFYPDGVAAVMLANALDKPVIITARGSDLNLIPQFDLPRKKIVWAAQKANAIITVCQALKDVLLKLGVPNKKISVLRNGVDLKKFSPSDDRGALRAKLSINRKTILSVGNLVELKGHHLIIQAMSKLPEFDLLIAGEGQEQTNLETLISSLGLQERVHMLGSISQEKLKEYYRSADVLVLASSREGLANVLLESIACGTPVVATKVGGTPEVITSPDAGLLIEERSSEAIIQGIFSIINQYPDREKTRNHAEKLSWDATTEGQISLFKQVIDNA